MRASRITPWALVAATAALTAAAIVLDVLNTRRIEANWVNYVFPLAVVMSTAVGVVLATRRRENPIGWLLLANGIVLAVSGIGTNYAILGLLDDPGSLPGATFAALYDQASWPLLFAAFTAIAFVFPDGHLPSPRWRRIAIAATAFFALQTLLGFFAPRDFDEPFDGYSSPLPRLPEPVFFALYPIVSLGLVASLFAAAFAIRTRMRRARCSRSWPRG